MKFGEKYELLESLTTGAIETFAANDKVRGERVLVHIVECASRKADQSTSEWVLESFRRLAPEPPGPILETGKYSGTQYAYVVSKPSDEAAVKSWVRRYELQVQETRETSVHRVSPEIKVPSPPPSMIAPAPPAPAPATKPAPGQMTQMFRDFDSLSKSRTPDFPPAEKQAPARSVNLVGESGLHASTPWDPASVKPAAPRNEKAPESFSTFSKPVTPDYQPSPAKEGPKPGEFTSFFQGPFRGDAPADVPTFSSEPITPPRKTVGEFTALFGQATQQPSTPGPAGNNVPSTGLTGLFKDLEKEPQTFSPSAPVPGAIIPPSQEPVSIPPGSKDSSFSPQAPIFITPPSPVIAAPPPIPPSPMPVPQALPAIPSSPPGDGATGAFTPPAAQVAPTPVEVPAGPSPYTQIISRPKLAPSEDVPGEAAHAPTPAGGGFAAPPMPKIPPPPPMPKIPPPPPMPKMTAPKPPAAPKLPKIDAPPPPPVSSMPLIITLAVLFLLAVLLVLYFVLKH